MINFDTEPLSAVDALLVASIAAATALKGSLEHSNSGQSANALGVLAQARVAGAMATHAPTGSHGIGYGYGHGQAYGEITAA